MSALTTPRMKPPFTMIGSSVAEVEESKHPNFPVGATIVIMAGLVNQLSPLLSLFQHLETEKYNLAMRHCARWVERGIVDPDKMNKDSPGGDQKLSYKVPTQQHK